MIMDRLSALESILAGDLVDDPLESSGAEDQIRLRALIVLGHAVIEEALEEVFRHQFRARLAWMQSSHPPASVVPFSGAHVRLLGPEITSGDKVDLVRLFTDSAPAAYEKLLNSNHGIKISNVKTMARPFGLYWPDFETGLADSLRALELLGAKRGSSSHLSPFPESRRSSPVVEEFTVAAVRQMLYDGAAALCAVAHELASRIEVVEPRLALGSWDGN